MRWHFYWQRGRMQHFEHASVTSVEWQPTGIRIELQTQKPITQHRAALGGTGACQRGRAMAWLQLTPFGMLLVLLFILPLPAASNGNSRHFLAEFFGFETETA